MQHIARDALTEAEVMTVPVDFDLLASFQGVRAIELVAMAQAGCLIPENGGYRIQVNEAHPLVKRRFTTGHEIGHTLIPAYRRRPHLVQDADTGLFDAGKEEEYLCDVAAAELLFPDHLFRPAAQVAGCTMSSVFDLAAQFQASREAAARRLVETEFWPCAFVVWHHAFKKSEQATALQYSLGDDWQTPTKKLRVRYAVASKSFGHFIPQHIAASEEGSIAWCFTSGELVSGDEVLQIGREEVRCHVTAAPRSYTIDDEEHREVLSLVLKRNSGAT